MEWMKEAAAQTASDKDWEMEIAKRAWDARMSHRAVPGISRSRDGSSVRERARAFERKGEGGSASTPGSRIHSPHPKSGLGSRIARSSSTTAGNRLLLSEGGTWQRQQQQQQQQQQHQGAVKWGGSVGRVDSAGWEERSKVGGGGNFATFYGGKKEERREYQPLPPYLGLRHSEKQQQQEQQQMSQQEQQQQQLHCKNLSKEQIIEQWVRQASSSQESSSSSSNAQQQQQQQHQEQVPPTAILTRFFSALQSSPPPPRLFRMCWEILLQPITKYATFVLSGPSVARTAASQTAAATTAISFRDRHQDPAAATTTDPLRVQAGTGKVRYKLKRNFL